MTRTSHLVRLILVAMAMLVFRQSFAYQDPANTPAVPSRFAAKAPLLAVARAGSRLVAVGLRGDIVLSDDDGNTWRQAEVPVSSDLVAVSFPSAQEGWAAGHGGVVLNTTDGGATWVKQLDGQQAGEITARHYAAAMASGAGADVARAAHQAKTLAADGSTQSLLDIRLTSDKSGFAVGTFNRIFHTDDGGKTWTPWMDRTDNPQELHFYSITSDDQQTYLAGERGMVWRLDPALKRFVAIPTSYRGTLFGLLIDGSNLLAYGMRGSLLRSGNGGRSWQKLDIGTVAGITGGVTLPDGRIALVTEAGEIWLSNDHGKTFKVRNVTSPMPYYGVAVSASGHLVVVGPYGVRVLALL